MSDALFEVEGAMVREAGFSPDRHYRYWLSRSWDDALGQVMFVGLNPSTADHVTDDPTIRRCITFARRWGYGRLVMCNLFSLISSDPKALLAASDPVGPDYDHDLRQWARFSDLVVECWGAFPEARKRAADVRQRGLLGSDVAVLGLTADGSPIHPMARGRRRLPDTAVPRHPVTLLPVPIPAATPTTTGGEA